MITRGLIEYDCLGLAQCAATDVREHCPCARRFRGECVPFPRITDAGRTTGWRERVAAPAPTLADVMPAKLKRRPA